MFYELLNLFEKHKVYCHEIDLYLVASCHCDSRCHLLSIWRNKSALVQTIALYFPHNNWQTGFFLCSHKYVSVWFSGHFILELQKNGQFSNQVCLFSFRKQCEETKMACSILCLFGLGY